ncbi:MAG: hypothetical protein GXO87_06730 [Chlorobi bacterium]|nr:hypothetical protein [Chlorobiota bacterium]
MRLFNLFIITIVFLVFAQLSAQTSIYVPRDVNKSYENGIRNYDGTPGENYWQNGSDYNLNVEIIHPYG